MNRIDLHCHTLLSDGELMPIELARRAYVMGHTAVAATDHASISNLDLLITSVKAEAELVKEWDMDLIAGVEITHVPKRRIDQVVAAARKKGAEIIVIHGETVTEPVERGTNAVAVNNPEVDILAHPGFITLDEAQWARDNDVILEITARKGHNATNGHVASMALQAGAKMVVNTDTHAPSDLIDYDTAMKIAMAAGLPRTEAEKAVRDTPLELLKKVKGR
ncbi:MAG TPA: histidinol phosphate phosphatase domain-containing protein [Methanomassiliicoccales archaeon]|jgi:histidinol phosphatase-like PHP family hydrolase|nr:histidinol phosphate phosphatase domain-containing protein [Methanomassiliicoccales archaeon]